MNESAGNETASVVPYWFKGMARAAAGDSVPELTDGSFDTELTADPFDPVKGIEKILVINLNRDQLRWEMICAEASRQALSGDKTLLDKCERFAAVDGLATARNAYLTEEICGTYTLEDYYSVDPQPVLSRVENRGRVHITASPQEMAVAQSHINIWKSVAQGGRSALVVEDDIKFSVDFVIRLRRAWAELPVSPDSAPQFDLLYLSYRPADTGVRGAAWSRSLFKPAGGLWWMSGYVLSPAGAMELLEALPVVGPIDQWVNHQFRSLDVYATTKRLITQNKTIKSNNSYSMIPILRSIQDASIGHIAKTESATINGRLETHARTAPKKPVFAIGLNKTGTTSLHEALSVLGYKSCHWRNDEFSEETRQLIESGAPLPFEAYTDVASVVENYQQLDRRFPSAVFILTIRDLDGWLASRAHHVALNRAENATGSDRPHAWVDIDPVTWRTERLLHHEGVFRYFKDRPEKLLVFDVSAGDGWSKLCRFLGCDEPSIPFPSVDPLTARAPLPEISLEPIRYRPRRIEPLPEDDYPWIIKPAYRPETDEQVTKRLASFGRTGNLVPIVNDRFVRFDVDLWEKADGTSGGPSNLAYFSHANVSVGDSGVLRLTTRRERSGDRSYTAGAIATHGAPAKQFIYGRFGAELKPARADGILTGMFLYRRDPLQEIDLEFLGARPTHMLVNVYCNPGVEGDPYNFGTRGSPALIDLGFDASEGFHQYAIEWEPTMIRWFVDDQLVFARTSSPIPVPNLPMRFHLNTWPIGAEDLAGTLDPAQLPAVTEVRSVAVSTWVPGTRHTRLCGLKQL